MEFPEIDTSAEISQPFLAANNQPSSSSSSLATVAGGNTKKADFVRDNINQEDILGNWIPITSESTDTQGQIKSQEKALKRIGSTPELVIRPACLIMRRVVIYNHKEILFCYFPLNKLQPVP
ncbi:hypothetical protein PSHT_09253 [Puccinia striiformis]|uniref:Uncharacterized protein n=1 Tax=Puccinia striiformis TaxID=27350 RepID=A0A2S4VHZ8_9BASI|nr:hypothetical protein PSHT_09253 [Puccinia striiformis]